MVFRDWRPSSPLVIAHIGITGRITHGNSVIINNNTMMAVNNDFLYSNAEGEYRLDPEYIKNTFSSFATQLKLLFGLPYLTKTKLSGIFVSRCSITNRGITSGD